MENSELNQELTRIMSQPHIRGWGTVAEDAIRLVNDHSDVPVSEEELEAKIGFVYDTVEKIASHRHEPTIIYEEKDHQTFWTFIPNPHDPIEAIYRSDTDQEDTPILRLNARSKQIPNTPISMTSARQITIPPADSDMNHIYMGPGIHLIRNSPDAIYGELQNGLQIAVGNDEVAELFTSLRTNESERNIRLFGALFHVALLADDFDVKIPVVPAYQEEGELAIAAITASAQVYRSTLSIIGQVQKKLTDLHSELGEVMSDQEALENTNREAAQYSFVPSLANGRPLDHDASTAWLTNTRSRLSQETGAMLGNATKFREQLGATERQLKIARTIIGYAPTI